MATKYYVYTSDDKTLIGLPVDEDLMDLYVNVVFAHGQVAGVLGSAPAPTAYADLAALQVAAPTALAKPSALTVRGLGLSIPGFGAAFIPVLSNEPFTADNDLGYGGQWEATLAEIIASFYVDKINETDVPFPNQIATEGVLEVMLTGYRGESRLSN